jgi:transposase-like protein
LRLFAVDLTAVQIAELVHLNRNTVNRYLTLIRQQIASYCESESPFSGEVSRSKSYFGAKRVRGKRGRGAYGKTIVFGIYKRNGCVYTEIVPNCSRKTLYATIQGKVDAASTIHTDGFRTHDGIVDLGFQKHYRVQHGNDESAVAPTISAASKASGASPKSGLSDFVVCQRIRSTCILKNCEFRFNYRNQDLYKILMKITGNFTFC